MLYLTMSPRQLTYSFTEIEAALKSGDLPLARQLLWEFYGVPADDLEQPGNRADRHRTGPDQFASLRFCDYYLLCAFAGSVGPGSLSACRVIERTVG